jgi:hypothetical protein
MKFRHEWKYEISVSDMYVIRSRLRAIAQTDQHAVNGMYAISSLYFDNPSDTALREKLDGVNRREKFRIRYYNDDLSVINLEKKSKYSGLCSKISERVTQQEVQDLLNRNTEWMNAPDRPLVYELYRKMETRQLQPKTIVAYTREPFVFPAGHVRVTIDRDIRTGMSNTDFLNPQRITIPAGDSHIILEVKWTEFLPDIIKEAVFVGNRRASAFSKYAQCRIYG